MATSVRLTNKQLSYVRCTFMSVDYKYMHAFFSNINIDATHKRRSERFQRVSLTLHKTLYVHDFIMLVLQRAICEICCIS